MMLKIWHYLSFPRIQPFDCWSVYCAGKAARDIFHKTLVAEHNQLVSLEKGNSNSNNGETTAAGNHCEPLISVLNYAPGPLDTDMQTWIRNDMPVDSSIRDYFVEAHAKGQLIRPATSAAAMWKLLWTSGSFKSGDHVDFFDIGK